jgi:hypothetical protein
MTPEERDAKAQDIADAVTEVLNSLNKTFECELAEMWAELERDHRGTRPL